MQSTTTPNSPTAQNNILGHPHIFVDSLTSNIPVTAASRGVKRGHGIDRQYALYLYSGSEGEDIGDETLTLEDMLKHLAIRYPNINFQKYEKALQLNGISHLDVAAKFDASWYTSPAKIDMSAGEAALFKEWVLKEMVKREDTKRNKKEARKVRGKKRVRVSSPEKDEGNENIPPIASSSRVD